MDDEKLKIISVDIEDAFLSHQATNEEIIIVCECMKTIALHQLVNINGD